MLDKILKLAASQCEEAEVYLYRAQKTPVEFRNNRLKSIETVENEVLSLRVVSGGRLGFSTSTKSSDINSLVANALATAAHGDLASFSFASAAGAPELDLVTPAVQELPIGDMVKTGEDFVAELRRLDSSILGGADIQKSHQQVSIATSRGAEHSYNKTTYSVFLGGEMVEGQNFLHVYDGESRTDLDVDVEKIKDRVIEDFRLARKNVEMKSGRYPVIITPGALQFLLMRYMACLSGKAVERGISPWTDKLGQKVLHDRVSFYDDPGFPGAAGSVPVDDEGVPAGRMPLIDNGVIRNYVLDLSTASALSMEPTGNGFRDKPLLNTPPQPKTTNLVMVGGDTSLDKMVEGLDDGVLVDQLMGAWAGNPYSGEVSGNISLGYRIRNGKIEGRIKDSMFSVNAFEALSSGLLDISRDRKWGWGKVLLPYLLLDGVHISTRS